MEKIKIKYISDDMPRLKYIGGEDKSNWIDLYAAETVVLFPGDFRLINLGVCMELPPGYEANFVPRSSTFKNFGIIQTNHFSVIDRGYCGDDDWWKYPVYATRQATIHKGERICQFRINRIQPTIEFEEVETLGNPDRGGFGSTGV